MTDLTTRLNGLLSPHSQTRPLSQRLHTAREQLSAMFEAGELDPLDGDTRCLLRGLELFLQGASEDAEELESGVANLTRWNGALVESIVEKHQKDRAP